MDDLVKFLRAQLDEDAEMVRRNSDHRGLADGFPDYRTYSDDDTVAADEYIEHFGPARALREIEAKRLALDHYAELERLAKGGAAIYRTAAGAVAVQIQIMALAYADRSGYREAWRPEHLD